MEHNLKFFLFFLLFISAFILFFPRESLAALPCSSCAFCEGTIRVYDCSGGTCRYGCEACWGEECTCLVQDCALTCGGSGGNWTQTCSGGGCAPSVNCAATCNGNWTKTCSLGACANNVNCALTCGGSGGNWTQTCSLGACANNVECTSYWTSELRCAGLGGNVPQQKYMSASCSAGACVYTPIWYAIDENCNVYDVSCTAYGSGCEARDWYCSAGACTYTPSNRHTDSIDDYVNYCSGNTVKKHRLYHDWYCTGGICTDHTSWGDEQLVETCTSYWTSEYRCSVDVREQKYMAWSCPASACVYTPIWYTNRDCSASDNCYTYDSGCEARDYYCSTSINDCTYTYSNRHTDSIDPYVNYCYDTRYLKKHRLYHDWYCDGVTCNDHTSWGDDQSVQDCGTSGYTDAYQCSGATMQQRQYASRSCSGDACITTYRWDDWTECNYYDNCYVYGSGCEYRDYYCSTSINNCDYTPSNRHTDSIDPYVNYCYDTDTVYKRQLYHDWYCDGVTCNDHSYWGSGSFVQDCTSYWTSELRCAGSGGNVPQQKYMSASCSAGACVYTPIWYDIDENCNVYDGCYAYGSGCEARDYYCSAGACTYSYSNRHEDSIDSYVNYCFGNTVRKHRLYHDWYCTGGICTDHTSWGDDQLVETCTSYWTSEYRCSGDVREQKYMAWSCPASACVYTPIWYTNRDCNASDGCANYDSGCEDRNWYCSTSINDCTYSYSNRHTDSIDPYVNYCYDGSTVYKHQLYHDWYCDYFDDTSYCNDHSYWGSGSFVQDCGSSGYTGNYQCSSNWVQAQYVTRGCSAGACYGPTYSWVNVENCDNYDEWFEGHYYDYYCSTAINACDYNTYPDTPTLTAPPTTWINYDPTFQAQVSDWDNEKVKAYFEISGSPTKSGWGTEVNNNEISSLGPIDLGSCSSTSWRAYTQDVRGGTSGWTSYRAVKVDKDAPSASISYTGGATLYCGISFTVFLGELDSCSGVPSTGGNVQISYDNGQNWYFYGSGINDFTYWGDRGSCYKFKYQVRDNAGNLSAWSEGQNVCIKQYPNTPVLQVPADNTWLNSNPTFQAQVSDPDGKNVKAFFSVVYGSPGLQIDSGFGSEVSSGGTSSWGPRDLGNCIITYNWQAFTQETFCNSFTSGWTALRKLKIDKVSPPTPTISYPTGFINYATFPVTLTWSDPCSGIASGEVQKSINGGAWQSHSSTINNFSFTGSDSTSYKLKYQVKDNAGNTSTWAEGGEVKIDTTPPIAIISYTAPMICSTTIDVTLTESDTYSGIDYGKVEINTNDGISWTGWTTLYPSRIDNFSYTANRGYRYKFRYQTRDNAGNPSAWSEGGETQIKSYPNVPSLQYPPDNSWITSNPTFQAQVFDPQGYSVRAYFDIPGNSDWGPSWVGSGQISSLGPLDLGNCTTTFWRAYTQESFCGFVSSWSNSQTVKVDKGVPSATISYAGGATMYCDTSFIVSLTESDGCSGVPSSGGDVQISYNNGQTWNSYSSTIENFTYPSTRGSCYKFKYQVRDNAGNLSAWSEGQNVCIKQYPNTPVLQAPADDTWLTSNPTFQATVSDPDGKNVKAFFKVVNGYSEGGVWCMGNTTCDVCSANLYCQDIAGYTVSCAPDYGQPCGKYSMCGIEDYDYLETCRYTPINTIASGLGSEVFSGGTSSWVPPDLGNCGTNYGWQAYTQETFCNSFTSGWTALRKLKIDKEPPTGVFIYYPTGTIYDNPTFTVSLGEEDTCSGLAEGTVQKNVNGTGWVHQATTTYDFSFTGQYNNSYQFRYQVKDNAGNLSSWVTWGTATLTQNRPPAVPTLIGPPSNIWLTSNPTFQATVSDPEGQNVRAHFDILDVADYPGGWVSSGQISSRTVDLGLCSYNYWQAYAEDSLYAISNSTPTDGYMLVKVDKAPPYNIDISYPEGTIFRMTFTVELLENDSCSGVAEGQVEIKTGTGEWGLYLTTTTDFTFTGQYGLTYTFKYRVKDNAGNWSPYDEGLEVTIGKNDPPDPPSLVAPPTTWINYNPRFQVRVSDPDRNKVKAYFQVLGYGQGWGNLATSGEISEWDASPEKNLGSCTTTSWRAYTQDNIGASSSWSGYWTVKVDKDVPSATATYTTGMICSTNIDVTLTGSDTCSGIADGKVEISTNGGAWTSLYLSRISNFTYPGVRGSYYKFRYQVSDNAGNPSAWSEGGEVRIKQIPSSVPTLQAPSDDTWLNYNPTFQATVSDPDGKNVKAFFKVVNGYSEGGVWCMGNTTCDVCSANLYCQDIAGYTVSCAPDYGQPCGKYSMCGIEDYDYLETCRYTPINTIASGLGSEVFSGGTSSWVPPDLGNCVTNYGWQAYTQETLCNLTSGWSGLRKLKIDKLSPPTPTISYQTGILYNTTFNVTLTESDPCSEIAEGTVQKNVNGTGWVHQATTTGDFLFTGQYDNTYQFRYQVRDNAGNLSDWATGGTVTLKQNRLPDVPTLLNKPPNNSWINYTPTFEATVSDPDGQNVRAHFNILYLADYPGSWVSSGQNSTRTVDLGLCSSYYWQAFAEDSLYAISTGSTEFNQVKVDKAVPYNLGILYPNGTIYTDTFNIQLLEDDFCSGVTEGDVEVKIGTGAWSDYLATTTNFTFTGQYGLTYTFRYRAKDAAGNWSGYAVGYEVTLGENTAPLTPYLLTPPITWINYNPTFRARVNDPDTNLVKTYFQVLGYGEGWGTDVGGIGTSTWDASPEKNLGSCATTTWRAYAQDEYGASSSWTGYRQVKVDKDAPPTPIISYTAGMICGTGIDVTLTESDTCSGIPSNGGEVQISTDGGAWTSLYSSRIDNFTYTGVRGSYYKFRYQVKDNAGNPSAWSEGEEVRIKRIPNILPIRQSPPHDTWVTSSPTFQAVVFDPDGYNVRALFDITGYGVVEGDWVTSGTTSSKGPLDLGNCRNTDWLAYTQESLCNLQSTAAAPWRVKVDKEPPTVSISYPNGTINYTFFFITLTESDPNNCSLVAEGEVQRNINSGGDWSGWQFLQNGTINFFYTGIYGYSYQFRYRARDNAGNRSDWSPSGGIVTIMNTPPVTPVLQVPPNNAWINYDPTFAAQVTDPDGNVVKAYFQVLDYGEGWGTLTNSGGTSTWDASPAKNLGNCATKSWHARAQDEYGANSNNWSDYWTIKVDKELPTASLSYATGSVTSTNFNVTSTESDTCSGIAEGKVEISINGGPWQNYLTTIDNFTYTGSEGYTYQFRYRVKDNAGNWSDLASGTGGKVTISNVPPNVPILQAPPNNTWINYNPTFAAQVTDPGGDSVRAYFNISGYGDGYGNWVDSGLTSQWKSVNLGNCTTTYWRVCGWDEDGGSGDCTGYLTVKVDKDKPTASISYPTNIIGSTSFNVNLTASDTCSGVAEGEVERSINGGAWQYYTSTISDFSYTGSSGNTYQFRYRVRDNANNWSDWATNFTVTLIAPFTETWLTSDPTFQAKVIDSDGENVKAYFQVVGYGDGEGSLVSSGATSTWGPIDLGSCATNTWRAYAIDASNNSGDWSSYWRVRVDKDSPTSNISYLSDTITTTTINVTLTELDGCSGVVQGTVEIKEWPNGGSKPGSWSFLSSRTDDFPKTGTNGYCYQFRYQVKDNAGNWSDWSEGGNVCIDLNNPPNTPTLKAPPNNIWINYDPTFQATAIDPDGDDVRVYFNVLGYGDGWGNWASSSATSSWGPRDLGTCATNTWRAYSQDRAGTISDWSGYWIAKVDKGKPTASISYPSGTITTTTINIVLTATDTCSGIAEGQIEKSVNGGAWQFCSSTINNFSYIGGSTYQFRYQVKDNAGNWSDWSEGGTTTIILNQPPTATNLTTYHGDYCDIRYAHIFLSWIFSDPDPEDSQSAYQVQIATDTNFTEPLVDDSGKVLSSNNSYSPTIGKLSYNNTYYWRLMVWDTKDTSSGWISGPSFSTPNHAYPFIDFRWVPQSPVVDEKVNFIDLSTVFGEATKKDWYWEFQDGTPPHSNKQNPETKFSSVGDKTITLTLTDSYDFTCSDSRTLTIQFPLPEWKEIPPFIPAFLENPILAEIEKGFNEIFSLK